MAVPVEESDEAPCDEVAPRRGAGGMRTGGRRHRVRHAGGRTGPDAVGGGDREGVGVAVGEAGDGDGAGRARGGLAAVGGGRGVGRRDGVAGDSRPAVEGRRGEADTRRGVGRRGRDPGGAPGAVASGVSGDDAVEAGPVPMPLVAVTVKV